MNIKVGKKEYNIEFTFEAAESESVNKAFDFFTGAYMMKKADEIKGSTEKQMDCMIGGLSDVPKLTIDFLYMGLLENHAKEVKNREEAKELYKQFCKENPEDERAYHYGMFEALKEQMSTDGFFKRIGVEQFMSNLEETVENAEKTPQDHKKKQNIKALEK